MHVSDAKLYELMASWYHNTLYNEHVNDSFNGDKKDLSKHSERPIRSEFLILFYTLILLKLNFLNGKFGYISSIMDEATREVIWSLATVQTRRWCKLRLTKRNLSCLKVQRQLCIQITANDKNKPGLSKVSSSK